MRRLVIDEDTPARSAASKRARPRELRKYSARRAPRPPGSTLDSSFIQSAPPTRFLVQRPSSDALPAFVRGLAAGIAGGGTAPGTMFSVLRRPRRRRIAGKPPVTLRACAQGSSEQLAAVTSMCPQFSTTALASRTHHGMAAAGKRQRSLRVLRPDPIAQRRPTVDRSPALAATSASSPAPAGRARALRWQWRGVIPHDGGRTTGRAPSGHCSLVP